MSATWAFIHVTVTLFTYAKKGTWSNTFFSRSVMEITGIKVSALDVYAEQILPINKVWWLCLVFPPQPPGSLVMWGTEWPKFNMVIQGRYFSWTMTSNSLENEEHGIPSQILKTSFGLRASVILDPNMCGFQYIWRLLTPLWYETLLVNWQN